MRIINLFARARRRMAKTLKKDKGLYIGYQANIAMLLHDRYGIVEEKQRNQAADDLIKLIFGL